MEAGTLAEWLKRPGDVLKRGDVIAVVETQKGAIEVEVFEDGVLERTLVNPGEKVPVGAVLAAIRGTGPARPPAPATGAPESGPAAAAATASTEGPAAPQAGRARVSPAARKLAADLGVDLATVKGTGAQGATTHEDVERAAAAMKNRVPEPAAPRSDRTTAMRAAIAAAMARSKREIPHYYLSTTIDVSAAFAWLRAENERRPLADRVLPAVLLIKAVALALGEVPELNGHWIDGGFRPGAGVHVGCAISLRGGGLVAPAIHDADRANLTTLMHTLQDLVARARAGSLRSSELADPTITVTNLGEQGVESTFGIIYPPQGPGRIREDRRTALDRIRSNRSTPAVDGDAFRRPSGQRRPSRRCVPRRRGSPAETGAAMNADEIRIIVIDVLRRIAPEIQPAALTPDVGLRDELDSMDFLNVVLGLHERLGVEIPESDYARLSTLGGAVAYLAAKIGADRGIESAPGQTRSPARD